MKKIPLSDYPRPQLVRDSYLCLNGEWDYAISKNKSLPLEYDGKILVPYSPETPLSGVNRSLTPEDYLFYHREIEFPEGFIKDKVILHFTAVDQIAEVFVNDIFIGKHIGGFLPFSFDIKQYLKDGKNSIKLIVKDYSDTSYYSRGKQRIKRGGIWYTPQSGIYLPVWIESVNEGYIESVKFTPDIDNEIIKIFVKSSLNCCKINLEHEEIEIETNKEISIKIKDMKLWDVDNPYLYNIQIKNDVDSISSYFAMRKFSIMKDKLGHPRLALNNKIVFMMGLLDQGYYHKGYLTPESYEDYEKDILLTKRLGFNVLRKHIKFETLNWYHLCDKYGIIVWQDFVSGGTSYNLFTISTPLITNIHFKDNKYRLFGRLSEEGREQALQEYRDTIEYLYNVPSIGLWTIFNEGWGQFDAVKVHDEMVKLDNTRIYDHASGWHDQGVSDTKSHHCYFKRFKMPKMKKRLGRSVILSECGGYSLQIKGHTFSEKFFGYKRMKDGDDLVKYYNELVDLDIVKNIKDGLSAFIYTELSDVEDELNGFVTYDREVIKVDEEKIKQINQKCIEEMQKYI